MSTPQAPGGVYVPPLTVTPTSGTPARQPIDPYFRVGTVGYYRWNVRPDEWREQLRGTQGPRTRAEMGASPMGAAISRAISLTYRRLTWDVETATDSAADKAAGEFLEQCMDDMKVPWSVFVNQIVAQVVEQGFALFETVYKRRTGPGDLDFTTLPPGTFGWGTPTPTTPPPSKYTDGRIGWEAFELRPAETLLQWDLPPDGGPEWQGVWQLTMTPRGTVYIPRAKTVLFKIDDRTGSPAGSGGIFDAGYEAWYFVRELNRLQGILFERYGGIPVINLPTGAGPDNEAAAIDMVNKFTLNEQSGFVLREGYTVQILSPGSAMVDLNAAVQRHEQAFFRSCLASFLMLGGADVGSWALSKDQSDFFIMALGGWLGQIADVINKVAVPTLFKLNGMQMEDYPRVTHASITQRDWAELAQSLQFLVGAGWVSPQPEDEEFLRQQIGLPERTAEEIEAEREQKAQAAAAMQQARLDAMAKASQNTESDSEAGEGPESAPDEAQEQQEGEPVAEKGKA